MDFVNAQPLISIIVPVYNQADHIRSVVLEYINALEGLPQAWELWLVVNGNRDGSLAVCQELASEHAAVQTMQCEKAGWGHAVKRGLATVKGNLICYTNSARTSPRDLQLLLLYAIANPGHVIKANRKIRESWRRRLGSLLYNIECRALFDLAFWDVNGTPKVFPRECTALFAMKSEGDLIDAEFNAICRREQYPILEVPIFSTRRHGGKSTTNYGSALRMYVGAYRLWRTMREPRNDA